MVGQERKSKMYMAVGIDDWKPVREDEKNILLCARYLMQTVEKTPNGMLCLQFEEEKGDEDVHSVVIVVRQNPEAAQKLNFAFEAVENAIIDKEPEEA